MQDTLSRTVKDLQHTDVLIYSMAFGHYINTWGGIRYKSVGERNAIFYHYPTEEEIL
jgi:hypothetical protein